MTSIILIIAINIAACIITFVSTAGKIVDRRRKGVKIIRRGGWILIICFIATIGLTFFQYYVNQKESKLKDLLLKSEQGLRDSIIEVKRIESNTLIIKALADYNVQYSDSLKKIIQVVRDSSKGITNIYSETEPSFKLDIPPVTLDSSSESFRFFSLNLRAFKGETYNANIKFEIVKQSGTEFSLINKSGQVGIRNGRFTEGTITSLSISVYASRGTVLFFYVYGDYTNSNKSKKFPIDEICIFDLTDMSTYSPVAQLDYDVRAFMKLKGIIKK